MQIWYARVYGGVCLEFGGFHNIALNQLTPYFLLPGRLGFSIIYIAVVSP